MNGLILCTKDCNLRCKYCFEEPMQGDCIQPINQQRDAFSAFVDNYLDTFTRQLIEINIAQEKAETHITFHGGEPLLVGHHLLRKAFEIISRYPKVIISIQTNGTLINEDVADLLAEYKVQVGVSLDGPAYMHDAYRRNIAGNPTHELVMQGISRLKARGNIPGALATVTDLSVKEPEAFYHFFVENEIPFSFNPCFTDPNLPSSYKVLNMAEYIEFYKKMFDLWINDTSHNNSISCFERIISAMGVKKHPYMEVCSFIPDCSITTVAIDTNGDFFRCLHYCMDGLHRIGNLSSDALNNAVGDPIMSQRWEHLKCTECKDCDIQDYCCGGCPYVAETINGTVMSRANTCASQKAIVHHIYDYLRQYVRD